MKNQTIGLSVRKAFLRSFILLLVFQVQFARYFALSAQDYVINRGNFSGWYTGGLRLCVADKNEFYSSYTASSKTVVRRYKNGAVADWGTNTDFPNNGGPGDIVRDSVSETVYISFFNSAYDAIYTYKRATADNDWVLVNTLAKPSGNLMGYTIKLSFNYTSNTLFMSFCEQTTNKVYLYELVSGSWVNRTGATSITCVNSRLEITAYDAKVVVTTTPGSRLCVYSYDVNSTTISSLNQNITNVAGFATTAYIAGTNTYISAFGQSAPWMGVKVVQSVGGADFTDMTGTLSGSMDNGSWGGFITYNAITAKLTLIFSSSTIKGYYWSGTDWTAISIPVMSSTNTFALSDYKDVYFVAYSGYTQIGIYSTNEVPRYNTQNLSTSTGTSTCLVNFQQRGDGYKVALFICKSDTYVAPVVVDNTSYTANPVFKLGSQLGSSGWYCVYNGVGESVNISALDPNATYQLQAFEYNGSAGQEKYAPVTAVSGNPASFVISSPLPVNWMSFTARIAHDKTFLNWVVADEKNNDRYEVQRSADGIQFTLIGTLPSRNDASYSSSYQFEDNQPLRGDGYYRIRQVDMDGQYSFSSIVRVNMSVETAFRHWMLADGSTLRILVPVTGRSNPVVRIYNLQGQTIRTGTLMPGWNDLDMQQAASSMYMISVLQDGKQVYTARFIK